MPLVGSALAFAGMPGRSGEHFVLAESEARFVAAVCRLSRDPAERARLGRNARELATRSLDWDAIGDRLAGDIRGGLAEHRRIP